MRKAMLALGVGIGYVLGSRAGRQRYEQLTESARQLAQRPELRGVSDRATGLAQQVSSQPQVQRVAQRATGLAQQVTSQPQVQRVTQRVAGARRPAGKDAGPAGAQGAGPDAQPGLASPDSSS